MSSRLAPLVLLLVASASSCGGAEARSVLLVTLDTTRADALGAYGRTPSVTPHLDRLAAEGVVFERAYTVAPLTQPAHASMLTGLVPPRHGVRDNGLAALPEEALTLAEAAREAGLATAAFLGSAVLDQGFGLDQGFETYLPPARRFYGESEPGYAERPAAAVAELARGWLMDLAPERPFFLWAHFWDPHAPHEPSEALLTRAGGDPYLAEVAACDLALGRILSALEERGDADSTLVIVVADHGEAFGEHGEVSHGPYVWDTTLRVPFLVRRPGGADGGERVNELASVADVAPTALAALGLDAPDGLDGLDLFSGAREARTGLYFESVYGHLAFGWHPLAGALDAEAKLVRGARDLLFGAEDLGEEHDLAAAEPETVARLARVLDAAARAPRLAKDAEGIDGELKRALGALGYAALSAENLELPQPGTRVPGLPDPHERLAELRAAQDAAGLLVTGSTRAAEDALLALLRSWPDNAFAQDRLAELFLRTGRAREAQAPLQRVLESGRGGADTWARLGAAHFVTGDETAALAAFTRALELDPNHVHALGGLLNVMESAGMSAEAAPFRERFHEAQSRP